MSWIGRNGELSRDREPTEWGEWCDIHNDSDTCFRLKEKEEVILHDKGEINGPDK